MTKTGTFRSLRVRNYRLYWSAQLVSQLGTWMRLIAVSWLVLTKLGGGGAAVGLVAAAQFTPTLIFGAWAGVLTDRFSPLAMLRITQLAMICVDTTLVVLVLTNAIQLWMVFVLVSLGGLVAAFDNPARQALVGELVEPDLVPNAVALNSMGFNGARIIGPAIAGVLIEVAGTSVCFALDACSYMVAFGGLVAVRRAELFPRERVARAKKQVRQGLSYAMSVPVLRATLLTMAVVGTISMNFTVFVPLLARTFTHSAGTFGVLSASMGIGSLVGSAIAARRTHPTLQQLAIASLLLAFTMAAVAASPIFQLAAVALAATGACVMLFLAATNSLLQLNSRPDMRGRVVALYVVLYVGTSPFGAPIAGWIAQTHGPRAAVAVGALGAALGTVIVASAWLPSTRRARLAVPEPVLEHET